MAFHVADTHHMTSEGAVRMGLLKERCGLEPQTNFFSLRNRQKLVQIRFENIQYVSCSVRCLFDVNVTNCQTLW